ncbi:FAD/NAD(P)-binding oxidoreductase [Dyella sp. A6]|uniref:FAD/NAD(P)-binding oxidoreductase n=1 Tax=Dyella aluminiiresistens TaxID=3069105 RepID=UPI002E7879CA|nr:FAD/NAD(P)-binding oxidoreductase [Dyella sp. A6]
MSEPRHYDVLVVGAGPAGLSAARTAAGHGARVGLVDLQPRAGGQVWRHDVAHGAPRAARQAIDQLSAAGVELLTGTQVVDAEAGCLRLERGDTTFDASYCDLILATGARELLLPFPGWTLPGVTAAGGLQALAKQGFPVSGRRVLIAGSGPLLLAAAATLRRHGAQLLGIVEQAPRAQVMRLARQLWRWPARAMQALQLQLQLADVPRYYDSCVTAAQGHGMLESVELQDAAGTTRQLACDLLGVGFGLLPNVELAALLGCALDPDGAHQRVRVDAMQRTSTAHIYAVGEACGIGGLHSARLEGAIAAHTACGHATRAQALLEQRDRARRFAVELTRSFALQPRVRQLARPDTLVCRCEDVPLGALDGFGDARAAKLATRCGMGACQGRICGAALAELGHFPRGHGRPPVFPARLATLAAVSGSCEHHGACS